MNSFPLIHRMGSLEQTAVSICSAREAQSQHRCDFSWPLHGFRMAAPIPGIMPTVRTGEETARANCSCPFAGEKQSFPQALSQEPQLNSSWICWPESDHRALPTYKGRWFYWPLRSRQAREGLRVNMELLFLGERSWDLNPLSLSHFYYYLLFSSA